MPDGHQTTLGFETPAKDTRYRRRWGRLALLAVAVVAVALATLWAVRYWTVGRFLESTNNAYLRADAVVIAPKISGYVTAVRVGDNQEVTQGQVLLEIDRASYEAARDLAVAEVAQRQADIVRYRADLARQEAAQGQAAAQVGVAAAAAKLAGQTADRFNRLSAEGAGTAQRADEAEAERVQGTGRVAAAAAKVRTEARERDSLVAQIGQGEAALKAAEAKLRRAETDLDGAVIKAPVAGRIGDRTARVGQYVQPGTRAMTVVPVQDLYLVANFKETQTGRMRAGQPVEVTVDALSGATIRGTLESLAPGTGSEFALLPPENATGNFTKVVQRIPVRIRLEPDAAVHEVLRPGLSAEVSVDTRTDAQRR